MAKKTPKSPVKGVRRSGGLGKPDGGSILEGKRQPAKKKRDSAKAVVSAISQLKTGQEMPPIISEASSLVAELEALRIQLLQEHAAGPPDRSDLASNLSRAQAEGDRIRQAIMTEKTLAKKRKSEIDDWKLWYHSLSADEKPGALSKLDAEIAWRARELNIVGDRINELNVLELSAIGAMEHAKQRLAAFDAGVYQRSVLEDPRLKGIDEALRRAKTSAVKPPKG